MHDHKIYLLRFIQETQCIVDRISPQYSSTLYDRILHTVQQCIAIRMAKHTSTADDVLGTDSAAATTNECTYAAST